MYRLMAILLFFTHSIWACLSHDKSYYNTHPKALQEAMANCPEKSPKKVSCAELKLMAMRVNELVDELRISPQGFGQSILTLQQKMALQHADPHLKNEYEKNQQELQERLAIVGWLESPEQSS